MEFFALIGFMFVLVIVALFIAVVHERQKLKNMSPQERRKYRDDLRSQQREQQWGSSNASMICPHCQAKGGVRTKSVVRKKGISGGKATAAILTGGVSILATGLSRKEELTQAHCDKCNNSWDF